jgi:hypothetical protein
LNLLICVVALILILRWKALASNRRWWIAVGTLVALVTINSRLVYEVPEVLNQIETWACNTIVYGVIPLVIIFRIFQSDSRWLKAGSVLIFVVWLLSIYILWLASSIFESQIIGKFESQDGHVYLVKEDITYNFIDSQTCVSVRQYRRILPGILVYQRSFSAEERDLDAISYASEGMWKCSESSGLGESSIGEIRRQFQSKSPN